MSNTQDAYDFFANEKGYSPAAASAIVGGLMTESGLDPNGPAGDPSIPGGSHYIGQWNRERLDGPNGIHTLTGTSPANPPSFRQQLEFVDHELNTTEKAAGDRLRSAKSPDEAALAFAGYERPQGWKGYGNTVLDNAVLAGGTARLQNARNIFDVASKGGDLSTISGGSSGGFTPRQVKYADLWAPPPVDPYKGNAEDERMKYREGLLGEFDAFQDAWSANTITGMAWKNSQMPGELRPDPGFAPSADDIKSYAKNAKGESLPPEYLSRFSDALSDGQAKWIAQRAWEDVARRNRLASLGWANNLGLNTAATLLDPATWLVAGATSGAVNPVTSILAQSGRLGMIGARALEGGVSNVAITAALNQTGVPTSDADYLSAMALGMALGAPFGALGKAPHTGVADGVAKAGTALSDHAAALGAAEEGGLPIKRPSSQARDGEHGVAEDVISSPRRASDFNVGRAALDEHPDVANDTHPSTTPTADMIDAHARSTHPDLFSKADDLDNQVAQARAQVQEAVQPREVEPLAQSRLHALQDELGQFTGKRRSSPAAKAIKAEIAALQASAERAANTQAGSDASRLSILRQRAAELDVRRGLLGPEIKSARDAAEAHLTKSLAEQAAARPLSILGPVQEGTEKNVKWRRITAANDPYNAPAATPGGHDAIAPDGFHGSSVGAQQVQYPVHPLDLNSGDIGTVREKGQFTSNLSTKNANRSHVLFPASGTQLASSPFAATRMIAAFLAGNPLGYKNAKNPIDAAMRGLLMRNRANGILDRFLKPAFHEWAADKGYGRVQSLTKKPEFMREVYNYITAKGDVEAHPAVARYANQAVKPLLKEWAQRINEAGLADHLPYDTNYLPRIYDPGKVGDAYRTHGVENLKHLVKASMADMEWTKALTPEQLDRVAKGYAEGVSKKALDLQEDWNHSWSADNLDHLRSVLVSDAGMGADEAKGITDAVARLTEKDRGANGRLKNRVDLDINAQHPATGDLKLSDMLVKDVSYLMERYNDQMSGRVALAKTKIVDPDTGDVIVNGIKSDADFDNMIREWKRHTEEQYLSKASSDAERKNLLNWRKLDEANMRFQYNRILSRGTEADNQLFGRNTQSGQVMRLMRKFSFDRMMGATGWSHMSIFGAMLSGIGFRAAMEHIPAFRHIVSMDGETIRAHGLDRELESYFGNHTDPLRGLQMHDWEHDWGATPLHQRNGILGTADHVLSQTNKITAVASGLAHIIDLNTRWAQKGIAQKFANMAYKAKQLPDGSFDLSGVNMRRMMQLGLDEGDMQKVLGQVKQHATTEDGILFQHKLTKLNLDKWDQEASHLFQGALQRNVDRIVQHNDVGSLHRWTSSPMWQMMMQFRNFPMVGQTKQLMFNIAMHDAEAANYFLTTSALGALIYIAREKVNSIGREDRDAYLEKRLSMHNIAHAALYHSGYAGMMPSMIDTGMRLSGADPLFDFRTTGNSSAMWGAPAVTNVDDFMKGAEAIRRPIAEDRTRSQAEARTLVRMFPWSNTLPMTLLGNLMVRNLPEHTPPKPQH